ncbi:cytochrome P450 [Cryptosporangium phraense]|uniref:Cytochrome P450 n=1 Tax=Cryptosporangium phraense TaxID=2593070 RepID=A0A545AL32_9ACTN|nr:cytochrome P450 [Cryptosporangium phraense]TQS42026.1 cytochrome P450 [Cryptosporangium phraense]
MTTVDQPRLTVGAFWGADPHSALTWLRENDPVYWDPHGQVWGITRYADVREVSLHPELFSSAGGIRPDQDPTPMMIDLDDPQHLQRRRLVSKGFTPRRVADQRARIDQITHALIDRVCERGACDFVWDLAAWLPLIVIGDQLGVREDQYDRLLRWSDDMMRGQGTPDDAALQEKMFVAAAEYGEYITGVLTDRRENGGDDLIGVLVRASVDGHGLDDEALYFDSLLLLIGGDETTRHVITGGLYQLLRDRSQWERLRADRSLLPGAIEEMLRWVSPIRNMARTVTRDVTFRGKALKQGQKLLLLYPSANRDAEVFEDPFRFDITRTPNNHLAFGVGAHFCLGNSLARLELTSIFTALLDRLPDLSLASPDEPDLRPASFVSGYEGLPVTFTPSAPHGVSL